ncbi:NAD(P)/FAD-dependent oxidoreductase [Acidovorax sp. NCPPB 3576]|uniref:NAD(P)/FAD-dependent oxidoreductase n=1 Tax=Acidovorax sp. NCPPB 3576 TaxID=2940488 RepID=UPI002349A3B1|nr:FAD-binding oxidoreductase [Acidovorax sp. NCPPB 3576]WCM86623.1 FAD-binding oxidoreductase [Acidovorax sp. NCPPB 3576]
MSGSTGTGTDSAWDAIVLGGGMAGASCAWALARHRRVLLLEREAHCGYHATGRSAALFSEYFGNRTVRALTALSRPFFEAPPTGFAPVPLVAPRGVVALATQDDLNAGRIDSALAAGHHAREPARVIGLDAALARCPVIDPRPYRCAVWRPSVMDIDVDALHQGYLRGLRAAGGSVRTGIRLEAIARDASGHWTVQTPEGRFHTPCLINAAGAWADEVAGQAGVAAIGLVPKRRTAVIVDLPDSASYQPALASWPMVTDLADTFYFKPEAGRLLVSPSDETPMPPCDVQPEEWDVAVAVDRLQQATTLAVRRVAHRWAGLRSFVADGSPVLGAAGDAPGFVWAAALGGYGIQIAPAVGQAVAALVLEGDLPRHFIEQGLSAAALRPRRQDHADALPACAQALP